MKKFLTILTFFLFISLNAQSLEKAIFPFTIDEQVQDYKENENIISIESKELNSDKYWNTPLTRLDYILFQLRRQCKIAYMHWISLRISEMLI